MARNPVRWYLHKVAPSPSTLLPPADFLPLIADHPLAIAIGEWVLDTAMRQIETWKAAGLPLPVSVNIDAIQLEQADFVQRLRQQVAAHPRLAAGDLELVVEKV